MASAGLAHEGGVFVETQAFTLECSQADCLADWLVVLMGQSCRQLRTRGDGACALHAVFGTPRGPELRCEDPRGLLRGLLGHPLETIRGKVRPGSQSLDVFQGYH